MDMQIEAADKKNMVITKRTGIAKGQNLYDENYDLRKQRQRMQNEKTTNFWRNTSCLLYTKKQPLKI